MINKDGKRLAITRQMMEAHQLDPVGDEATARADLELAQKRLKKRLKEHSPAGVK